MSHFTLTRCNSSVSVCNPPEPDVLYPGEKFHPNATLFELTKAAQKILHLKYNPKRFHSIEIHYKDNMDHYDNCIFFHQEDNIVALVRYFPDGSKHFAAPISFSDELKPSHDVTHLRWSGSRESFEEKYSFFIRDSLQIRVRELEKIVSNLLKGLGNVVPEST